MKAAFLLSLLVALLTPGKSQQLDSLQMLERQKAALLAKSRLQKTVGWVILGTGLPVVIGCTYLLASFNNNDISVNEVQTVLVGSLVYTVLSVPLMVAGKKNKAQAISLQAIGLRTESPIFATTFRPVLLPALQIAFRF